MKYYFFIFFLSASLFLSCRNDAEFQSLVKSELEGIRDKHITDRSLDFFEIEVRKEDGEWLAEGSVLNEKAWQEVANYFSQQHNFSIGNVHISKLPNPELSVDTAAYVNVSVLPIRRMPANAAEIVDQAIMGDLLRILDRKGEWSLIQTSYQYTGWVISTRLVFSSSIQFSVWRDLPKGWVKANPGWIYQSPDKKSWPVSDLVLNMTLAINKQNKEWTEVQLPDGRRGFLETDQVEDPSLAMTAQNQLHKVISCARSMTGVPYLWGGNSSKANDCSGFVQNVFENAGIYLPRDARQQALVGEPVGIDSGFTKIKAGDLLFFGSGERITHVALSLGGADFIHQTDDVRLNSLDSTAVNFSPYRLKTLKSVKRIIRN